MAKKDKQKEPLTARQIKQIYSAYLKNRRVKDGRQKILREYRLSGGELDEIIKSSERAAMLKTQKIAQKTVSTSQDKDKGYKSEDEDEDKEYRQSLDAPAPSLQILKNRLLNALNNTAFCCTDPAKIARSLDTIDAMIERGATSEDRDKTIASISEAARELSKEFNSQKIKRINKK